MRGFGRLSGIELLILVGIGVGLILWLVWREEVTDDCFGGYVAGVVASSECQAVIDEVGN